MSPGSGETSDAPTAELPPADPQPPLAAPEPAGPWGTHLRFLGREWPRAGGLERVFWGAAFLGCLAVLALAAFVLDPDPRGIGTHEQLGLPPCGFVEMLDGLPCPSCGYTTTFTLAAHGRLGAAFLNQPFGFGVFLMTVLAVPVAALATWKGISLFLATERWPWPRLLGVTVALWIVAWGYKCALLLG